MAMSRNVCYKAMTRIKLSDYADDLKEFIGQYTPSQRGVGGGHEHVYSYADDWPELLKYKVPVRQASNELECLDKYLEAGRAPSAKERRLGDLADEMLFHSLPTMCPPAYAGRPVVLGDVIKAFCVGARDKSPGFPLTASYRTKGEAFDDIFPDLFFAFHMRLLCLLYVAPYCVTTEDFINAYCVDLFAFSIKSEVVKVDKVGRPLVAFSYVDAAVEYFLLWPASIACKATCYETHSAIGIGFDETHGELLRLALGPPPHFRSDVPTFDGGVTVDEKMRVRHVHLRKMKIEPSHWLYKVAVQHERAIANSAYIMTNGKVYRPRRKTGQVSGRWMTSRINTDVRARRSFLVDALLLSQGAQIDELPMCAGDDANEDDTPGREEAYKWVGYPLRDAGCFTDIEFCSFNWDDVPYGIRLDKAVFNLLLDPPITVEKFNAFVCGFRGHPRFGRAVLFIFVRRAEMKVVLKSFLSREMYARFEQYASLRKGSVSLVEYEPHRKKKSGAKSKRKSSKPVKPVVLANNQDPRPLVRARKMGGRKGGRVSMRHVRGVCSVTDPFCPASKNSKWPDGTSGNTLTEQFRGVLSVSVDANGNGMVVFNPTVPFGMQGFAITGTPPGPYTATANATTVTYRASSMLATYGSQYRIVSFGCIVRCVASATQAAGIVTLGTAPAALLGTAYTMGQELYSETIIKAIQPGMEVSWISTPAGTGARDFSAQTTANNVQPVSDWNALWLEVSGATASTSPITIEYFINVEFTPLTTARALTAIARPNPPKSNAAEQAVSTVHSTLGSFIEGGVASVESAVAKHASEALSSFMSDPLESISSLFEMF